MPNAKCAPFDLELSVPERIRSLVPYVAGKPIEETKREFGLSEVIKLASNENPLGPSPLAIQAAQKELAETNRYPDASYRSLKLAVSKKRSLEPEQVVLGSGSNEIIDLAIRAFCPPGSSIVTPKYAFIAYKLCAALNGVECREAEVGENYGATADSLLKAVDSKTKIVFLANPNNPTGSSIEKAAITRLAQELRKKNILLILDYAYWEFVDPKDFPAAEEWLAEHCNIVVLQTFSKIYGLAGFRVGYGLARKEVTQWLERARQPFNFSSVGCAAAVAALNDVEFVKTVAKLNQTGRTYLEKGLQALGVKVFPSQGNFVFVDLGRDAAPVNQECLKRGVILRPLANYGLKTHLRISVGTERENEKALQVLKEALKK